MTTSPLVPADHPAHVLRDIEDEYECPHLDVELRSGPRPEGMATLRNWWATATVRDYTEPNPLNIVVARMSLTIVNEFLGYPVSELDAIDTDSVVLGSALWDGDVRTPVFEEYTGGDWGPVALVNSYEVTSEWRGTPLSPMIALRMLEPLAHLGVSAAALYAAPYNSDIRGKARGVAALKIAAMWERAGFERLHPEAPADTDPSRIMVRTLDAIELTGHLVHLSGSDPVLREAIGQ